jgi:RNA polymerase sigma-70 factor (ECF subfamily)
MTGRFERSVLPHLDAAYNLARWLVRAPSDAEDVVQEAYLRAVAHFDGFRGGDAKAWLLRIVRNCAYDWLKRRRQAAVVPLDAVLGPGGEIRGALEPVEVEAPDNGLDRAADRVRLNRLVAALPVEFREVLVLREVEEMSYRDIAAVVGVPVGTVMSRLARGRGLLRRGWQREARREASGGL